MRNKKFYPAKFISELVNIGERQLEGEIAAADFIESTLQKAGIVFVSHRYKTKIPKIEKAELIADGEKVDCLGASFVSGKIDQDCKMISSLESSVNWSETPNINFNPKSKNFSRPDFYFAPALSVKAGDIVRLEKAKSIMGEIIVVPTIHESRNTMTGNMVDPEYLLFAHYDSIGPGAIDNAGGVAMLMKLVLEQSDQLEKVLVVFSGNEELSYDKPIYWGHGFREFEKKYPNLLRHAKKILIVDGPGNGKTSVISDPGLIELAFPIKLMKEMINKIEVVSGDYERLMAVYHGEDDLEKEVFEYFLIESYNVIMDIIQ